MFLQNESNRSLCSSSKSAAIADATIPSGDGFEAVARILQLLVDRLRSGLVQIGEVGAKGLQHLQARSRHCHSVARGEVLILEAKL